MSLDKTWRGRCDKCGHARVMYESGGKRYAIRRFRGYGWSVTRKTLLCPLCVRGGKR